MMGLQVIGLVFLLVHTGIGLQVLTEQARFQPPLLLRPAVETAPEELKLAVHLRGQARPR